MTCRVLSRAVEKASLNLFYLAVLLGCISSGYWYGRHKMFVRGEEALVAVQAASPAGTVVAVTPNGQLVRITERSYYQSDGYTRATARDMLAAEERREYASDEGPMLASLFGALAALAALAGLWAYQGLRHILLRFMAPKWAFLVAGVLCAGSLVLCTGLIPALVEISKLPPRT